MSQQNTNALNKFIELARYIAANADEPLTLKTLAARVHLSPSRFQRVFKSIFGVSPKKFQQAARSEHFKALLRTGTDITDAIYAVAGHDDRLPRHRDATLDVDDGHVDDRVGVAVHRHRRRPAAAAGADEERGKQQSRRV